MNEVLLKTDAEIKLMRRSGKLLARVFKMLDDKIHVGMTTMEINDIVDDYITNVLHSRPASKGQYGFKFALNSSVNDVVCHGVPNNRYKLKSTDIINIDITLEKDGFITDSSKMYVLPQANPQARKLVKTTYQALYKGIQQVRPGATLGDIGYAIQKHAESSGYSIVREYSGHGIGRKMHENPQVLHFGSRGVGMELVTGMIFTIEPMINQGKAKVKTKKDGWTVVTKDKKLSAQWEHTVLVTENGVDILTLRESEID